MTLNLLLLLLLLLHLLLRPRVCMSSRTGDKSCSDLS